MDIDFVKVSRLASEDEVALFSGSFCEKILCQDLSMRRSKRDKYIEYYNRFISDHRNIISMLQSQQSWDMNLIEKCKKCKNEASRLLDIVYEY